MDIIQSTQYTEFQGLGDHGMPHSSWHIMKSRTKHSLKKISRELAMCLTLPQVKCSVEIVGSKSLTKESRLAMGWKM